MAAYHKPDKCDDKCAVNTFIALHVVIDNFYVVLATKRWDREVKKKESLDKQTIKIMVSCCPGVDQHVLQQSPFVLTFPGAPAHH